MVVQEIAKALDVPDAEVKRLSFSLAQDRAAWNAFQQRVNREYACGRPADDDNRIPDPPPENSQQQSVVQQQGKRKPLTA